jgi:general secretion pathway protein F
MTSFRYKAITQAGEVTVGVMEAATEGAVIERLRRDGNIPVRAEPAETAHSMLTGELRLGFGPRRGLSRQDVAVFTRELAVMLGAGQDLDRALRFLVETAPHTRGRRVIGRLRDAVRDGSPLATAMAQDTSFSRLYVGMVRAAEAGGQLAATLDRVAVMLERQRSLAAAVISALIYPCLLLIAAIGSIILLVTKVLPQFVPLFQQNGVALPRATQILIAVGDAISSYGLAALLLLTLLILVVRRILRRPGARLWTDRLILHAPVFGGLWREILAARFTRTLGTLLVNGVALISALGITRDALGNAAAALSVDRAINSARNGAGLSGLEEEAVFPLRTIHLLRLGHETAQLGEMSLRAADIHEEESRIRLQRLVSLLVPAITIGMGLAVAGIISSLLVAMLRLNELAG